MKILFLLPYLPYNEAPHAGGRASFNLINVLGKKHEIYGISFLNDSQEAAKLQEVKVHFRKLDGVLSRWFMKIFGLFFFLFLPLRYSARCSFTFLNKILSLKKEKIDVIIVDHSIMGIYVFLLRWLFPKACIIWNLHELGSLAALRGIDLSQFLKRIFYKLEYFKNLFWEKIIGGKCDFIFTFSSKEKGFLINLGLPQKNIVIIQPHIYSIARESIDNSFRDRKGILFFGKMDRKENWDAVLYFIKEIFPFIKMDYPHAKLFIVGANPHKNLYKAAKQRDDILITGYVKNIEEILPRVKMAVFPLRLGAGVRFKVLDALSWGIPVVTTSIGIEGIPQQSEVIKIANSPQEISRDVLHFLRMNDEKINNLSLEAKKFVKIKYDWKQNCENIEKIMREFCERR